MVQGAAALTDGSKRHARSLIALVMNCVGAKLGGLIAGTPPPPAEAGPVSQTARLPLPRARFTWTWRSGRLSGGRGSSEDPGGRPLVPGIPSITITN